MLQRTLFTAPVLARSLLLASVAACSDYATIGGLCPAACLSDAGAAACVAVGCVGDGFPDACAQGGCVKDAGSDAPRGCDQGPFALTRKRLELLVVVDDSASIFPWWSYLRDGFDQFLQDDASIGIGVGLQRFGQSCDAQAFVTPIVPIAPLPGNAAALLRELPLIPGATTSTIPALEGALRFARDRAATNQEAGVAVVLLTDATPGQCDALGGDYDQNAARVARAGYEGTPSVRTHVVGFGALQTLGTIARAGGTLPSLINQIPSAGEVAAALRKLWDSAQPCAFGWQTGTTLSSDSSVVVTEPNGLERRYEIQSDASLCDRQGGFYWNEASAPYPVLACPQTCASLAVGTPLSVRAVSDTCAAP